jgi:hypothetical protein
MPDAMHSLMMFFDFSPMTSRPSEQVNAAGTRLEICHSSHPGTGFGGRVLQSPFLETLAWILQDTVNGIALRVKTKEKTTEKVEPPSSNCQRFSSVFAGLSGFEKTNLKSGFQPQNMVAKA